MRTPISPPAPHAADKPSPRGRLTLGARLLAGLYLGAPLLLGVVNLGCEPKFKPIIIKGPTVQPVAEARWGTMRAVHRVHIDAAIGDRATVTLDPTERHGFEYQSWIGFSLFAEGLTGEAGRGGSYTILHADGREEAAVGFSLCLDPLVDAGLMQVKARRVFIPLGSPPEVAADLRRQGWVTVAAICPKCDAVALDCTHRLESGEPRAL